MARTVIALVGENRNGILECQSRRFNALLEPMGLEGRMVQLGTAGAATELATLLQGDIAFAWGYAGVGAQLALDGGNLWERVKVPFVSVLADAPFIMPINHHVRSSWVVNGYVYREWLELQRRHVRSAQISALLPMGVIPNEERHRVAWSERPLRMVFVKSGADPDRLRARWDRWPARLRPVLHDSAAELAALGTGPITDVVERGLAAHDVVLGHNQPLLFGLLHELDSYVRALRATTMVRALLPLPVEVIGDGWDHLVEEPGRARFHNAMAAHELDMLYAQTQILLNVTPNFGSGAHERVLRGFAARACVVSDDNDHARTHLHGLPSYHGVEWNAPDLPDRLAAIFHDGARYDDRLDEAEAYVKGRHDPGVFLQHVAELADVARLSPTMSGYMLDAA